MSEFGKTSYKIEKCLDQNCPPCKFNINGFCKMYCKEDE